VRPTITDDAKLYRHAGDTGDLVIGRNGLVYRVRTKVKVMDSFISIPGLGLRDMVRVTVSIRVMSLQ